LFPLFAIGINDTSSTSGKSTAGLLDTGVVDTGGKFAASVFDSSGKFLVHLAFRISLQILEKKIVITLLLFPGTWEKMIHEKNLKENLVTLSH
jgi:hypothetical protein